MYLKYSYMKTIPTVLSKTFTVYEISCHIFISNSIITDITDHCISEGSNLYSKTSVKRPLSKRPKIGFQDQLWLYAGQK